MEIILFVLHDAQNAMIWHEMQKIPQENIPIF